jgi:hypothetical protein
MSMTGEDEGPFLSLAQVSEAERKAWACVERSTFHFDGTDFWQYDGEKWVKPWDQLPASGWQHSDSCPCRFCGEE